MAALHLCRVVQRHAALALWLVLAVAVLTSRAGSAAERTSSPPKLLLQAVCVSPTAGEYIAIYNPNDYAVDLSNYYVTDATYLGSSPPQNLYPHIATGVFYTAAGSPARIPGGGLFFDFHARFPAGASIAAHDTVAVSNQGSDRFSSTYGRKPAYEFAYPHASPVVDDAAVPNMRSAFPGAIPGMPDSASLTNSGESIVLYYWDGLTPSVTDIDYVFWGVNSGSYVVNKSGTTINGFSYPADTPPASQVPISAAAHANGNAFRRENYAEGTQKTAGGSGVDGRDETSENLNVTWSSTTPAIPPVAKDVPAQVLTARAGGPYAGLAGDAISFNGTASLPAQGGTITAYNWTFGDGGMGTGATPAHVYTAAGAYKVMLTVTGSGGGTSVDSTIASISIGQLLTAHAGGPYTGFAGNPINFNGGASLPAQGGTITSYSWTFGDGGVGVGATPGHVYSVAGTYRVKLSVTGSGGGSSSDSTTATVSPALTPGAIRKLLLQAVCVAPTAGEYVAIYNPNDVAVDLSNYYLTDAIYLGTSPPQNLYPYIATGSFYAPAGTPAAIPGGGQFFDFHARFPAGAVIAPHDTIAVSHQGAARFLTTYGRRPTFDFGYSGLNNPLVPHMRPAFPGAIPGTPDSASLTNGGESIVLYYWDGLTPNVTDIDYVFWGVNSGSYVVNKSGTTINGFSYPADTPPAMQVAISSAAHANGNMFRREDYAEGTQKLAGGSGVDGRDETSENLSVTWSSTTPAIPPVAKPLSTPVTLGSLSAESLEGGVEVRWSAYFDGGASFQVLRATAVRGAYRAVSGELPGAPGRPDFQFQDASALPGTEYFYKVAWRQDGAWEYSSAIQVRTVPVAFAVGRVTPNPAGGSVRVSYQLPRAGALRVGIYDLSGRLVGVPFEGVGEPGPGSVAWDGRGPGGRQLTAGVYLVQVTFGGREMNRKFVLLR
jgi:PKD repeat protein